MKASSESGECASLISTGSFSVFEAVCWPGMGVLGSSFRAARCGRGNLHCAPELTGVDSPRLGFPQRDFLCYGRLCLESDGRKFARRRGLRGAGRAILTRESLAYRWLLRQMPASLFTGEPLSECADAGVDSRWNGGGHG